jgi:3-methyladenine DNA glycosylase AlkC
MCHFFTGGMELNFSGTEFSPLFDFGSHALDDTPKTQSHVNLHLQFYMATIENVFQSLQMYGTETFLDQELKALMQQCTLLMRSPDNYVPQRKTIETLQHENSQLRGITQDLAEKVQYSEKLLTKITNQVTQVCPEDYQKVIANVSKTCDAWTKFQELENQADDTLNTSAATAATLDSATGVSLDTLVTWDCESTINEFFEGAETTEK